jgi:methenyltetrahydrofolate cyclohydrolase
VICWFQLGANLPYNLDKIHNLTILREGKIMIKDKSIQVFLDELASKASTPGGGSAAAIIGAMGAALISMVANFTVGKKGYESVDAEAQTILDKSENLRAQLTGMIKADVDVFNRVMGAYGIKRSD